MVLRQRRADLDNQARFLEAEVANNKELESRITLYEREVRILVMRSLFLVTSSLVSKNFRHNPYL